MKIRRRPQAIALILPFLLLSFSSISQESDSSQLTIDRLFDDALSSKSFGPVKWLEGKSAYTVLESPDKHYKDKKEIVMYDAKTGERSVMIPAWRLLPPNKNTPIDIEQYSFTRNYSHVLIYSNTKMREFGGSTGDYWVLDLLLWDWYKIGKDMPDQSIRNAELSPDGKKVCFIFENNLYVEDLRAFTIYKLTNDGSEKLINGQMSSCNTSMLNIGQKKNGGSGYAWSPDSKYIAFVQMDNSVVPNFYMLNNTETQYPRIVKFPYVKVAQQLPTNKVGIIDFMGKELKWLEIPGESTDYIWQMEWKPNLNHLTLQILSRNQKQLNLYVATADGKVNKIHTEHEKEWIEPNNIHWVSNGTKFIHTSERDGWVQLYLKTEHGGSEMKLTPGQFDIVYVYGVDEKNGWIYYMASPENPVQRYLYRVSLDGKGTTQKLTPESFPGINTYEISYDFEHAIHMYSSMETPPEYRLITLPIHKEMKILEDNKKLKNELVKLERHPTEFFKIDIGNGIKLDGYYIKPPRMDPAKKYPLFYYIYGEPAGQTVLDLWRGRQYLWHLMLAQKGYVVMSIDPRGTPSPQGSNWRKVIYGQLGWMAGQDHASATKEVANKFSFIDSKRVGIYGHSGGGQMSLNLIFRYPDLYHLAMPSSFVSHQKFYHPSYQERFMGQLDDNIEGYSKGSPITWAHKLQGKLLIIHGTGDSNVHYQSFESLINELVDHKKQFSMMSYPNRNHGLQEGINTQWHLFSLRTNYLLENLPPGPK